MRNSVSDLVFSKRISAWWKPKLALLLGHCYLAFALFQPSGVYALKFASLFLISSIGFGVLGHVINDWADVKTDKLVGKSNLLNGVSMQLQLLLTLASFALAVLPWIFLAVDAVITSLLAGELVLFMTYALHPFRFKERGLLGLLFDSLYAFVIPSILVFYAMCMQLNLALGTALLLTLAIWTLFAGLYNILVHQINDSTNDEKTGQKTFAVTKGKYRVLSMACRIFLPLHYLSFGIFVLYISSALFWWYFLLPMAVIIKQTGKLYGLKGVTGGVTTKELQFANIHYHDFLPYWNLLAAVIVSPIFLWFLPIHVLVFELSWIQLIGSRIKTLFNK